MKTGRRIFALAYEYKKGGTMPEAEDVKPKKKKARPIVLWHHRAAISYPVSLLTDR